MVMPARSNAVLDAPPELTVGDVMETVAATMKQEQGRLDGLSSFGGDGTHGTRMARAWQDVAYATLGSGTGDAGADLQLAGEVLGSPEYGRAANILGKGLYAAGAGLVGRRTWSLADMGPVLQAAADAAQQDDEYKLGDGTLLDALVPAAIAYNNAISAGLTYLQAIQGSLGAAMNGVRRTASMPQAHNPNLKPGAPRQPDPGAASTQVFLTGLLQGLLGVRLPPLPAGGDSSNALINFLQQGFDLGGFVARPPARRPAESLLGDTDQVGGKQ
jgi:dihydroxyacetone kinase-like protein